MWILQYFFADGVGNNGDLEAVKQEILKEMRKEIAKAKQEIIDGENDIFQMTILFTSKDNTHTL